MPEANLQALRRNAWRYGEMRHPELIALWLVATQIHFRCSSFFQGLLMMKSATWLQKTGSQYVLVPPR